MKTTLLPFFINYLLLPLIGLLLLLPVILLKKKNSGLDTKTLIIFSLVSIVLIGLQGFWGLVGDTFSPYYYAFAQLLYGLGGVLYVQALSKHISPKLTEFKQLMEAVLTVMIGVVGMFVFALVFNLLSPIENGLLASSCVVVFLLPLVFYWTFMAYITIPPDIYKIWQHNPTTVNTERLDGVDFNKLMVLELEFGRNINDEDRIKVKAKALPEIYFGEWFGIFLEDYNRKFPDNPIAAQHGTGEPHAWIFYVKPSFLGGRKYIDPELSITDNRIREKYTIITKRVTNDQA